MDITGSFKVIKGTLLGSDLQYDVFLLEDRLLLLKTGVHFNNFRYIAAYLIPLVVLGTCTGLLGNLLIDPDTVSLFLAMVVNYGSVIIGLVTGAWIGAIIANRYVKPKDTKAEWYGELGSMSTDQLLSRDKNNFIILLSDITSIQLKKSSYGIYGPRTGKIVIQGTIYDIAPGQNFDEIKTLLGNSLSNKLKV